jgi:ATP-dependent Clp protease ATP-binding subunit ClpA
MKPTPRFERVIAYAKESLSRFGQAEVSSGHLVLGLLAIGNGIPHSVLRRFGLSLENVEGYLSLRRPFADDSALAGGVIIGPSALRAIERAEVEASACEHSYTGIDHLLLAIAKEESGEAAELFASLHVDASRIAAIVSRELDGPESTENRLSK